MESGCPAARAARCASFPWSLRLLCWPWFRMRPRTFVFITMMALCHCAAGAQVLTNALPPVENPTQPASAAGTSSSLPEDPEQEALPIAQPEPIPRTGIPVSWKADRETWVGHTATLYGVED